MKNISDIQALLDRYWEGETTLEEERTLKAYFISGAVDERFRAFAPFFQALREEQTVQYSKAQQAAPLKPVLFNWQKIAAAASLALLLTAGLWWWANREIPVPEQMAQQPGAPQERKILEEKPVEHPVVAEKSSTQIKNTKRPTRKTFADHKKPTAAETLDPETEQAMQEIKAALALVSSKIKKGKHEAAKGAIHLDNVDKIFKIKSEG